MIGRRAVLLTVASALSCADAPVTVSRAPARLAASPAAVFADGGAIALAATLDEGEAREVALSPEARVSLRAYGATIERAAQPPGGRALVVGARVRLDLHTAITQLDAAGRAVGRIDNPFDDAAGRARLGPGRRCLTVLSGDELDPDAWRVLDAYALDASGAALAEPALGFPAGTALDAVFAAATP